MGTVYLFSKVCLDEVSAYNLAGFICPVIVIAFAALVFKT
jgi:hypothetical protein